MLWKCVYECVRPWIENHSFLFDGCVWQYARTHAKTSGTLNGSFKFVSQQATAMKADEKRPAIDFWSSNIQGKGRMRNERIVHCVVHEVGQLRYDGWEEVARRRSTPIRHFKTTIKRHPSPTTRFVLWPHYNSQLIATTCWRNESMNEQNFGKPNDFAWQIL